jgi:hypothetical protein
MENTHVEIPTSNSLFPEPGAGKPGRWLNANKRMELNWVPFGQAVELALEPIWL